MSNVIVPLESSNREAWHALTDASRQTVRDAALAAAGAYHTGTAEQQMEADMALEAALIAAGCMAEDEAIANIDWDGLDVGSSTEHVAFITIVGDDYDDKFVVVAR
jgi:hypothetical protein